MKLLVLVLLACSVLATPDCYDYSVTTLSTSYIEVLPLLLYYGKVDWMTILSGNNCAFYTYGDIFFKSYDETALSGIYFKFLKGTNLQCNLDSTLKTFDSETWLYANSLNADTEICGYYVGVANIGTTAKMFQIIRTSAEGLKWSLSMVAVAVATYMLN